LGEQRRGAVRKAATAGKEPAGAPLERRGMPSRGRIVELMLGLRHGFIRLSDGRKVFFHRSDLRDGTSFSDCTVGETVLFELLEDPISGPRALRVERRRPRR
jgi:cold shock CspA family protein